MSDRKLADKQYKDGYQVLEGGDYLVRTEGTKYDGKHMVIRMADGAVMGEYCRREAANRRAQQLGGNSRLTRHFNFTDEPTDSFKWSWLNKQERRFAEAKVATTLARRAEVEAEKEREKERRDMVIGGPWAQTALDEDRLIDRTNYYSEIVSEATILKRDPRFDTPKMKKFLRQFSLGPAILKTEYGYAHAANTYRRAHVEAAWMSMSEHDRVRRCRQHGALAATLLDSTVTTLNPVHPLEAQAISRALAEFPAQSRI
jgi:hypothetical protein